VELDDVRPAPGDGAPPHGSVEERERDGLCLRALLGGAEAPDEGLEVGPGNVLTGLTKRIARDFPVGSTGDGGALEKALERAGGQT